MSWSLYLSAIAFFTILFSVFLAVAYSTLLGIYENYLRHCQKADLQWTGPGSRFGRLPLRGAWILPVAFLSAWLVVHFLIQPDSPTPLG